MSEIAEIPAHVPAHLVFDVDPYNLSGGTEDPFRAWSSVQSKTPDVYFTPHFGGFWILNRAALISEVVADPVRFSSEGGVTIASAPGDNVPPFPPLNIDPPHHSFFRKPLSIALGPQNLQKLGVRTREIVIELIEGFRDRGECEFMTDFAQHVPIAILMEILGLPFADSAHLLPFADTVNHNSDVAERSKAVEEIVAYADRWVKERRTNPGSDLISKLTQIVVGDRPITHDEAVAMVTVLLIGGMDSVSLTMAAIMRFLAESRSHRERLVANPSLIPEVLDELLRRHSGAATARVVTADMELGGVQMKAGDRIFLTGWLHGMDPQAWNNPMEVDFSNRPRDILTFGKGIHKCVGANLARLEIRTLLEEWLARIPDFSIKPGDSVRTMPGQTLAFIYLPLIWPAPADA